MLDNKKEVIENYTSKYSQIFRENSLIDSSLDEIHGVKRGLRDKNGKGVLAGLTKISLIQSTEEIDGKTVPCEGATILSGL